MITAELLKFFNILKDINIVESNKKVPKSKELGVSKKWRGIGDYFKTFQREQSEDMISSIEVLLAS